MTVVQTI